MAKSNTSSYVVTYELAFDNDNPSSVLDKLEKIAKVSNVKLFKDSLVKIIGDFFDCYDSIINLFGDQCQNIWWFYIDGPSYII